MLNTIKGMKNTYQTSSRRDGLLPGTALFMYDYDSQNLPNNFHQYFLQVSQKHGYNTRLASKNSYSLPKIKTNYGKFNIRFCGAKIWNTISEPTKKLSRTKFKDQISCDRIRTYVY